MRIVYVLNGTGLSGGVFVVYRHVEILRSLGVDAEAVGTDPPSPWYPGTASVYRRVASLDPAEIGPADVAVGTFWHTVESAERVPGAIPFHFCQGYEAIYGPIEADWPAIRAAYARPTEKLVVSPHLADLLLLRHGASSHWIPQPFDAAAFAPPARERTPDGTLRILLTGQWGVPFKGVEWAMRALLPLRGELPIRLVRIAQDAPDAEAALWPDAERHVAVPPDRVPGIVGGVDVFLGPSTEVEGFGLPTLEAMGCARASVLTDIGAFRAIDPEARAHIRIPEGDGEALRAAVRRLAAEPELRASLGHRGRRIAEAYTAERTGSALVRAFADAAARRGRPTGTLPLLPPRPVRPRTTWLRRLGLASAAALLAAAAPIAGPLGDRLLDPSLPAALPLAGRLRLVEAPLLDARLALLPLFAVALAAALTRRCRFGLALAAASCAALAGAAIAAFRGAPLPGSAFGLPALLTALGLAAAALRPRRPPTALLLLPAVVVGAVVVVPPAVRAASGLFRTARPGAPDLLLVVLDTTRRDALGPYGGGATPALAAFASRATVYENAVATAPWTLPSHASMFTGLLPSEHGATYATWQLRSGIPTLAERLSALGYETLGISGNPVVSPATGLARGFHRFLEPYADGEPSPFAWTALRRSLKAWNGSVAERSTSLAIGALEAAEQAPVFVFVNYFEPHGPYAPPSAPAPGVPGARADAELIRESGLADLPMRYATGLVRWSPADLRRERQLYDAEIAAVDRQLGRLLEAFARRPNGVVVVTADHGENFGEDGIVGHMFSMSEALLHVPLLVSDPRRPELSGARVADVVSLRELPAFLLAAARGEPAGEPGRRGVGAAELDVPRDLVEGFAAAHPGADVARLRVGGRALRTADRKLLARDGEPPRLFALDPERDVTAAEPGATAEARTRLDALVPPRPGGEAGALPLDEETKARLRSLGYLR